MKVISSSILPFLKPILLIPSPARALLRYFTLTFLLLTSFFALFTCNNNVLPQQPTPKTPSHPAEIEKIVVVASQKEDDTSWLQQRLPSWPVARYIVDDEYAEFQVPINKGKEAMVYLTFLIDHYDYLPDVIIFIHSLQYQWHNDDPNHDGATVLSHLQLPYVLASGYINLRCTWIQGCPVELRPNRIMTDNSLLPELVFKDSYIDLFYGEEDSDFDVEMRNEMEVPDAVGVSCCAQFAVSRDTVLARPKSHYEWFRRWLVDTPLDDEVSGRVFEYSWHSMYIPSI